MANTPTNAPKRDELLNTQVAAARLQELLPEAGDYWQQYLINNRRPNRNPPRRIPTHRFGGGVFYAPADLAEFAEWEKKRRLGGVKLSSRAVEALNAFGIGDANGSTTGRKLDCTVTPQLDPVTHKHFVQIVVKEPLLVFRVEIEQAKELHAELAEVLACVERWTKE